MNDIVIDLDEPVRPVPPAPPASAARWSMPFRVVVVLGLALGAGVPQAAPVTMSRARTVPLPSYCTGAPMAGGRLNILQGDGYIILDGTTKTIISQGHCPAPG